ncbi:vWA domain-containing protein [Oecophyllibacter saccharovorans]|uniref:vWA domain-containing protein n=1 Tax=Oecophyllibacter saccharovorans TaxID=2558360 RepID=UPI0011671EE0|nr:vWA domain-containing protein [Oecophyllibacter saccharovorans]TPW36323.1 VWA domain-containing protein [Oecophyllibacter saccharovorans]
MRLSVFSPAMSARRLAFSLGLTTLALLAPLTCLQAEPLLQAGKKSLYQHVITRPGAQIFPTASGGKGENVEGFRIFYVFGRQTGRVQVGDTLKGQPKGWIPEDRTIPWQHTMIAAFTNPAGRSRALFLDSAASEDKLLTDPDSGQQAAALTRQALAASASKSPSRSAADSGPVVALEPENYIDITKNFYLLPILDAHEIERDSGPSVRRLHVISAPAEPSAPQAASPEALKKFRGGLVFVIDTTTSMEPYIQETRAAIKDIVNLVGNSAAGQNFRFGLIGYRDSLADAPKLGYATKLFAKPDFSQPLNSILPAIADVHATDVSSSSFDEDAAAGVKSAIDDVDWDGLGGRYIVLITDAGARDGTDPHSLTRLNIPELRRLAAEKGIALFVVHLLTPAGKAAGDHAKAATQYRNLSSFNGQTLYYPVPNGSPQAFRPVVQKIATQILQQVADTTGRPIAGLTPQEEKARKADPRMSVVAQAMRLAYLGRLEKTGAPDIVQSYTADRDPANTLRRSLDIRVLLTRNQLSDLAATLQRILDAGLAGKTDPKNFFQQLQATFAASARNPSQLGSVDRIGNYLGEYLDGLPYKSEIASITPESWLAMGAGQQRTLLNSIASRLRLYQDYEAHPELWVRLGSSKDPGDAVFPVPLDELP